MCGVGVGCMCVVYVCGVCVWCMCVWFRCVVYSKHEDSNG